MNLIVDVGNTRTKLALYQEDKFIELIISTHKQANTKIESLLKKRNILHVIISSVGHPDSINEELFRTVKTLISLDHNTNIPFKNKYKSPKTLGVDRIALVSAAAIQYPKENVLVIDAGTCITYDILNKRNEYLGGAISPGINIRYKSLNDYTANLPLLDIANFSLIGKNTNESIQSGILNGVIQEIEGVIEQYRDKYSTLTVVLTGGNANFLAKKLKSSIFANPNFLLEGLNSILIHNIDE